MLIMKKIIFSIILLISLCINSFAGNHLDSEVNWDKIAKKFQKRFKLVLNNFDKIWYEGYPTLEVQLSNGERAWKITKENVSEFPENKKPEFSNTRIGYADVSKNKLPIFQFVITEDELEDISFDPLFLLDNKRTENIAVGIISDYVFHEAFHYYVQEKSHLKENIEIISSPTINSRNTLYPVLATPRIYRNNIYQTLVSAFENKKERNKYLSEAKYWFLKYRAEYPTEASRIVLTDIDEGTAKYVETMVNIFVNIGFSPKEDLLRKSIIENIKNIRPLKSVDAESYPLGVVSGVLMNEMKIDWKRKVLNKKTPLTPLDILFEGISPATKEPEVNYDHISILKKYAKDKNERLKTPMDLVMSVYKKEIDYKLLVLPMTPSSYNTTGHYTNSLIPEENTIVLNYKQNIIFEGGSIEVDDVSGIKLESLKPECGYESSFIVILDEDNSFNVEINALKKEIKDNNGHTFVCVQTK
jgi:hypothetical protein